MSNCEDLKNLLIFDCNKLKLALRTPLLDLLYIPLLGYRAANSMLSLIFFHKDLVGYIELTATVLKTSSGGGWTRISLVKILYCTNYND